MDEVPIVLVEHAEGATPALHVRLTAANIIDFEVNYDGLEYHKVLRDICRVAYYMISLDGDLQEAYDDAGRTPIKQQDRVMVGEFFEKYRTRIADFELLQGMFS